LSSSGEVPCTTNDVGMTAEALSMTGTVSEESLQPQEPSAKLDILGEKNNYYFTVTVIIFVLF